MNEIDYKIIRSGRRTVAIVIEGDGAVTVRAPDRMPARDIAAFVEQKRQWITKKRSEIGRERDALRPIILADGKKLPYLGGELTFQFDSVPAVRREGGTLLLPTGADLPDVRAWLRSEARRVFQERVPLWEARMDVRAAAVKASDARSRWGSCSGKNSVNLSWRLVLCPMEVVDYVIVHELSHIAHHDHSPAFWALVERTYPLYREAQAYLKQRRALMDVI